MSSKRIVALVFVWFGMATGFSQRLAAQQASPPAEVIHYADSVLYNGKVLTADEKFTTAEAVAIREGKFLALGKSERILAMAGPKTRKIDLKGKAVIPGIIDVHQHPFTEGIMAYWVSKNNVSWEGRLPEMNEMERQIGVGWTSGERALRDIKRAVEAARPGDLIVIPQAWGRGVNLCAVTTLAQIDALSPNNPIIFIGYVNLWPYAMNSKAAEWVQLPAGPPTFVEEGSPGGAGIAYFRNKGSACISEQARNRVAQYMWWRVPLEDQMPAFRAGTRRASAYGVTMAKEHTQPSLLTGIRELWVRGELTVRLRMPYPLYPSNGFQTDPPPGEAEVLFDMNGNMSGFGDDMLRFSAIRPPGVGGNTQMGGAWTLEAKQREVPGGRPQPYGTGPAPSEQAPPGQELFNGREALIQAVRHGWSVSADHTVGDRAVEEVLKAMEEGLKTRLVKTTNQVLTVNHTPMIRPEQIEKMKQLGIRPSLGAWHIFWEPALDSAVHQYGIERVQQMIPMKSYIKLGLKPALEGDLFIDPPFWRMQIAITRKDSKYGRVWNPAERVSRQEALWMSTAWGAHNLGEEDKLGSIEPGKLADLVVIDKDYMTIPEEEISKIKVLMTILGGKVVYEVPGELP